MIWRALAHQLGEPAQLLAGDRPVVERRVQHPVGMPQGEKGFAVACRPGGGEPCDEVVNIHVIHRWSPRLCDSIRRSRTTDLAEFGPYISYAKALVGRHPRSDIVNKEFQPEAGDST